MGLVFPSHVLPRVFCLVSAGDDLTLLPALAAAGITGFQVRDKVAATRALIDLTRHVRELVGDACVIVDDRVDVALAAGADGVHLGADDLPIEVARRLGPGLVIGATCRSRTDIVAARAAGADYAGFGPIRATGSKAGLPEPLGAGAIRAVADAGLPVIAIGGIDAATAAAAGEAGAHGVAVIGAIWRDPDPVQAAKELVAAVG
ncbi:thiamine phosphate synthase [Nocardioides nematodiphilus]|uniref:thiamine phosphate synthase n=1 Tax=Nocardioides nematodiphilus TaxID=2849669 RepID=UPI001CD9D07F|nr:thiamine phosphate synthase [Nocardioides nematodiphilus]MCA1982936.1 thiamine phosphate synthase [Nocardioides nematodiphilus]